MYVVIKEQVGAFSIQEQVALVVRIADFSIPSGITADILTEKGSLIVASGPGVPAETGAPSANGQVWISDDTKILGGYWGAQTGGGGDVDLTNNSGSDQVAGTVVIHDADHNQSFTLTTILRDRRVIGVLSEDIINGAQGKVSVAGKIVTVKVQGNVSRGQWLIASATTGRAQADGYTRGPGAIGMAVTAYAGGGAGTVSALIAVDLYLGAGAVRGYATGGNAGAYAATTQVLSTVSETVSIVAGAALSLARNLVAGASSSDKGVSFGGYTGAGSVIADRTTYATDVTAAVSGANLPAARSGPGGISGSLAAYIAGGRLGGGDQLQAYKMPWATETTAAQASANLTAARSHVGKPVYSSTIGYFTGGYNAGVVATADKMPFSTEITAAIASGNLSSARLSAAGLFNSTNGYWSGGSTGTVQTTTDKMPFSTETTAAVGGAALSAARKSAAGVSGLSGYILGGSTTNAVETEALQSNAVATTDKLNFSADTMAAAAGANLATSMAGSGSLLSPV